jgi:hypothetical protein
MCVACNSYGTRSTLCTVYRCTIGDPRGPRLPSPPKQPARANVSRSLACTATGLRLQARVCVYGRAGTRTARTDDLAGTVADGGDSVQRAVDARPVVAAKVADL